MGRGHAEEDRERSYLDNEQLLVDGKLEEEGMGGQDREYLVATLAEEDMYAF